MVAVVACATPLPPLLPAPVSGTMTRICFLAISAWFSRILPSSKMWAVCTPSTVPDAQNTHDRQTDKRREQWTGNGAATVYGSWLPAHR